MQPDTENHASARRPAAHIAPAVLSDRIVLVAGGKGGVGTSVTASLLALGCAIGGARVLLIDGHEGNGTLHYLFGVRPQNSLESLRDPAVALDDVCMGLGDSFTLVPCKPASEGQLLLTPDARRAPFERLLPLSSEYDCVIVDGGSRLDGILAVAQCGAGRAVVVTDADRISLAASFALLKVLSSMAGNVKASVLVNRNDEDVALRASAQLIDACSLFLGRTVPLASTIADDVCLRAAIGAGMPIGDAAQGSLAAQAMETLALQLFPHLKGDSKAENVATRHNFPPHLAVL